VADTKLGTHCWCSSVPPRLLRRLPRLFRAAKAMQRDIENEEKLARARSSVAPREPDDNDDDEPPRGDTK